MEKGYFIIFCLKQPAPEYMKEKETYVVICQIEHGLKDPFDWIFKNVGRMTKTLRAPEIPKMCNVLDDTKVIDTIINIFKTIQTISIPQMAGKVRGKIYDDDESTIRRNWPFLIDNIKDDIQIVMEHLFQKHVLEYEDMEKINKKIKDEDIRAGACLLLKTMMQSGPNAYQRFIECLKEAGFTGVVDELQGEKETIQTISIPQMAGKVRGKISDDDGSTIRRNWPFLIDNIKDHTQTLMEHLFQKHVLECDDMEKINKRIKDESSRAGATMLLTILMRSGPDAYQRFKDCLKEDGFAGVVDKLQEQPTNASSYQQGPAVTVVIPDKDWPKGYSGHERIRATSIDPLQGRNATELGELGEYCETKEDSQITSSTSSSTTNQPYVEGGEDFPLHDAAVNWKDDKFKAIVAAHRDDILNLIRMVNHHLN